jgi:hypothetical protein
VNENEKSPNAINHKVSMGFLLPKKYIENPILIHDNNRKKNNNRNGFITLL